MVYHEMVTNMVVGMVKHNSNVRFKTSLVSKNNGRENIPLIYGHSFITRGQNKKEKKQHKLELLGMAPKSS